MVVKRGAISPAHYRFNFTLNEKYFFFHQKHFFFFF